MSNSQTTTDIDDGMKATAAVNRLVFPHGVANLTIRADASMAETYHAAFEGPKPQVSEQDGVISIDYPRFNPLIWGRTAADITINPARAWAFEIGGGVSRWDGDLRPVTVNSIDIRGGASEVALQLPSPAGSVPIHVSGGASKMTLRRPDGVPARLAVGGGASKLGLDDQFFGAVGGPVRLESGNYSTATDRYDVEIGGGASKITVGRE
ncbi:MAG TPA: hypothetical protein VM674_08545 [Candidatus Acidoferrum sp.]|nr:hypothetical protein [Candidatus Acidoferrum sp.]